MQEKEGVRATRECLTTQSELGEVDQRAWDRVMPTPNHQRPQRPQRPQRHQRCYWTRQWTAQAQK